MVAPWQLCHRCCCRYGIFPVLVVPIVSFGCLLSLYSSVGCKFVDLEIGFQPINTGWDATPPYSFGALFYHNATVEHDSMYRQSFHGGCVAYSDQMYDNYIANDRTFKMIQIMTLISCAASGLAMLVAWLFVISPVPAGFLWPAVLLPSIMVAFISEGSKFLIFDTGICRSSIWYRGTVMIPEKAESCTMGETAWFACAAGVLHFWALVCVCLRSPERRIINVNTPFEPVVTGDLQKEEIEEETSDDMDLEGAGGSTDCTAGMEKGQPGGNLTGKELVVIPKVANADKPTTSAFESFSEIVEAPNCSGTEQLSLMKITPIDTAFGNFNCCSPMSEGKPDTISPELIPDVPERVENTPLSPVDFIIEGFDVATDLSQINVCRTLSWLPTQQQQKALEDSGSSLTATQQDNAGTGDNVATATDFASKALGQEKTPPPPTGQAILPTTQDEEAPSSEDVPATQAAASEGPTDSLVPFSEVMGSKEDDNVPQPPPPPPNQAAAPHIGAAVAASTSAAVLEQGGNPDIAHL